ncbi:HAD family hydrolase [Candidatus Woesearchaeota archaeon]|nr:HAD family hydrolase [Candidatus Woesearchaeota archaeon]
MRKKEVKAVLFDLDGVLINSIDAWHHTYNDIIAHFNKHPVSKKGFRKIFGNTIEKNVKMIVDIPAREANRLAITYFKGNMDYVMIFPQTKNVLEKLSNMGIKIALITNTPKKILMPVLKRYKIKKYFDAVVTIDGVKKGKPAPDMALKACKMLKVSPKNAIIVGDTKNDMMAGKRAGCITIGYKMKGDYRINRLNEIFGILK